MPEMTEGQLEACVKDAALKLGYLYYHTHRAQYSPTGFPDCVMVNAEQKRIIFAELKKTKGKPTEDAVSKRGTFLPGQLTWLAALKDCDQEAYLWRPADWDSGLIEQTLQERHA